MFNVNPLRRKFCIWFLSEFLEIGTMWLILHFTGKIPDESDKLNKYNNGTANTNLHLEKIILGILSWPVNILVLIWLSSKSISLKDKEQALKSIGDQVLVAN